MPFKPFIPILTILILSTSAYGQELEHLKELKRPRYDITLPPMPEKNLPVQQERPKENKKNDNTRFCGIFHGYVTVHYEKQMVQAEATLHIQTNSTKRKSHYDCYILPRSGEYKESNWQIDGTEVRRSITISGNTVYVTDIIDYGQGGNSQIRTLVFSNDYSALTFLKTEFDDARSNPATGQIIGRFRRVE